MSTAKFDVEDIYRSLNYIGSSIIGRLKRTSITMYMREQMPRIERLIDHGNISFIIKRSLYYFNTLSYRHKKCGRYSYTLNSSFPILYASTYAALTRSLFSDINEQIEKSEWARYINAHQRVDGLFVDPLIRCRFAEHAHHWGWIHLTVHALMALTALGHKPRYTLRILDKFKNMESVMFWLKRCINTRPVGFAGNEIFNYGTLLQYARDYLGEASLDNALSLMYKVLDKYVNPSTGLLHFNENNSIRDLEEAIQISYHIYLLYFFDEVPIKHPEAIARKILLIQNQFGGFSSNYNASACEDIDCIDLLCRLYNELDSSSRRYVSFALKKALVWILSNMNHDGGFVFRRGTPFFYGHHIMKTGPDESSAFATWFRILSIAYITTTLGEEMKNLDMKWYFINSPGYQFWRPK